MKYAAITRREGLGEFDVALLHVIDFGYKTLHRCRAGNTN